LNDKKALEIFEACIDEMYKNSDPPTTWKNILQERKKEFYNEHSITEEQYNNIKAKYEKKLPTFYKRKLAWFLLDYSPAFTQKKVIMKDKACKYPSYGTKTRHMPQIIKSRVTNFDNQDISILICHTYLFYDIVIYSPSISVLNRIREATNSDAHIIRKSIFANPLIVLDTVDTKKDAIRFFNQIIRKIRKMKT